jgi:hypothetical protein
MRNSDEVEYLSERFFKGRLWNIFVLLVNAMNKDKLSAHFGETSKMFYV